MPKKIFQPLVFKNAIISSSKLSVNFILNSFLTLQQHLTFFLPNSLEIIISCCKKWHKN